MKMLKIPEPTVVRLSLYSRFLNQASSKGIDIISSDEIGAAVGIPSAQVRKDLSYFGEFGIRGVGYRVRELCSQVDKLLCVNQTWPVIIIGAGHLGLAMSGYRGLQDRGFDVIALFDANPAKQGELPNGLSVLPMERLAETVREKDIRIGIITVPADAAQQVAEALIAAGITAIINFAPTVLNVPPEVKVRNIDLTVNLEVLSFNLGMRG
ncbi:redox-sensing transcriptional repressor rex [Heliomicrobium modesticaldum Ice1]|uniref:Redox-sensing transcriptional repressor Rex n=1 Tax=Heliobacterium modesticaldum (strain ATCC 51547 / Ice1) TaxID=498761 RepID=B0TGX7_HELMI|nr:redox-sensing transcriptional repressor Rex [Heliomicrobium modesticaldum]ABZ83302.1 redox-sensing transcriptional repressor rex [Heliomicrobium modesticaldum Ice1]